MASPLFFGMAELFYRRPLFFNPSQRSLFVLAPLEAPNSKNTRGGGTPEPTPHAGGGWACTAHSR